jgi:cysteine-rich repeat protein
MTSLILLRRDARLLVAAVSLACSFVAACGSDDVEEPGPRCGDLVVDPGECEDGNLFDGDGCSSVCQPEPGYSCSPLAAAPCTTTCGDGIQAGAEACDDDNTDPGDGCDAQCALETLPAEDCTNGVDDDGDNDADCDDADCTCTPVACGNGIVEAPRQIIASLNKDLKELKSCRTKGLCCGAGGAQVFKEPEPGSQEVQVKRTEEIIESGVKKVALACPFCMVMLQDGLNKTGKDHEIQLVDLAELVQQSIQ